MKGDGDHILCEPICSVGKLAGFQNREVGSLGGGCGLKLSEEGIEDLPKISQK